MLQVTVWDKVKKEHSFFHVDGALSLPRSFQDYGRLAMGRDSSETIELITELYTIRFSRSDSESQAEKFDLLLMSMHIAADKADQAGTQTPGEPTQAQCDNTGNTPQHGNAAETPLEMVLDGTPFKTGYESIPLDERLTPWDTPPTD